MKSHRDVGSAQVGHRINYHGNGITDSLDSCKFCKADLRGKPIPKKYLKFYSPGVTHYSRLIGIEVPEIYDGVSFWECPDCNVRWDRWTGEKVYGISKKYHLRKLKRERL